MTWTSTTVAYKDGNGSGKTAVAYTDGTNVNPANTILDATGAPIGSSNPLYATVSGALPAGANIIGSINTQPRIQAAASTMTRVANTTAYAGGQFVANNTVAASCTLANSGFTVSAARATNQPGRLTKCILKKSGTTSTNASFVVHIFNSNPLSSAPANGDGGAFTPANGGNWLGAFNVTTSQVFGDSCMGIGYPLYGNYIDFTPDSATQNVYALLAANAAYTPASGEVFTLQLVTE